MNYILARLQGELHGVEGVARPVHARELHLWHRHRLQHHLPI